MNKAPGYDWNNEKILTWRLATTSDLQPPTTCNPGDLQPPTTCNPDEMNTDEMQPDELQPDEKQLTRQLKVPNSDIPVIVVLRQIVLKKKL